MLKVLVLASVAVGVFVAAQEDMHGLGELTAEKKAEIEAKISTMSNEAQEAAKKIKAIFEDKSNNKEMAHDKIETILTALPAAAKAELESLHPNNAPVRARRHEEGAAEAIEVAPEVAKNAPVSRARRHEEGGAEVPDVSKNAPRARRHEEGAEEAAEVHVEGVEAAGEHEQ